MGDRSHSSSLAPKESCSTLIPGDKVANIRKTSGGDDVVSTMTDDSWTFLRKKFFFPNDLGVMIPRRSDRARTPPPGYFTVFEMSLRAGLRFPPAPELIAILSVCEICLSQLSSRAMTIIMGLIVFFRDHGARLSPELLARIGRLTCDPQGRVTYRSKWLDLRTRDPPKSWVSSYFFVKNELGLLEKWGKLKELPILLHTSEDDVLRILNISRVDDLQLQVRYVNKYVKEDMLFKVGLSIQPGRSQAIMLKRSEKNKVVGEISLKSTSKRPQIQKEIEAPISKKKRVDEDLGRPSVSNSLKIHIPEEVLNHACTGYQATDALISQISEISQKISGPLKDWNKEFVRVKYLQGQYQRRYEAQIEEIKSLENDLAGCRTELSTMATSFSLHRQDADRTREELIESRAEVTDLARSLRNSEARVSDVEAENQRLRSELLENTKGEAALKIIEDFKASYDFKNILQDTVERERDHIFDVEVKDLEHERLEEGLIRGFLKGTRLVHRRTGADIEGLSWSQVSEDPSPDLGDDAESAQPSGGSSDEEIVSI